MCLNVNMKIHHEVENNGFNFPKPFIADKNIVVYKELEKNSDGYITPYRNFPVEFNIMGIAKLKSDVEDDVFPFKGNWYSLIEFSVDNGIHSYRQQLYPSNNFHYAIIPKGAKYLVGCFGDIVSEKLIIFKTKKSFKFWLFFNKKHTKKFIKYFNK